MEPTELDTTHHSTPQSLRPHTQEPTQLHTQQLTDQPTVTDQLPPQSLKLHTQHTELDMATTCTKLF